MYELEPRSRLTQACLREMEDLIEGLFANPVKIPNTGMAEAPIIGDRYIMAVDHSYLLPTICAAICAREKFRAEWAADLPLREEEVESLMYNDDPRISVLGYYGDSQRGEHWNPQHPSFATYVAGLLACEHAPIEIRSDCALRRQFPPRPLAGITGTGGWLTWRSPAKLAEYQNHLAQIAHAVAMGAIPSLHHSPDNGRSA